MRQGPSRERVTTIGEDGSRRFLQPAAVRGRFVRARMALGWMLIALFAAMPWIDVGGHPAVFLDVTHRRFHLFGATLGLGDVWMLFFVISGLGFTIYAITALLGRVWCGWACPQTVYLEHLFRVIDRAVEGDHLARTRLDGLPWTSGEKLLRRGTRLGLYLAVCWLVAHIFLAYFVSIPGLYPMILGAPAAHPAAFVAMAAATGALFFNFWWFREQLCLAICPYGRLQSALIDDDSVIVGYDAGRGEPRGRSAGTAPAGDCVDCGRCVQVCPTGIDIRQGLQLECVACTACIDACDEVMTRLRRPPGLVRYASLRELAGGRTRFIRPRTLLYAGLLLVGATVAGISLLRVQSLGFKLSRQPGADLYDVSGPVITNVYRAKVINKGDRAEHYFIEAEGGPAGLRIINADAGFELPPQAEVALPVAVQLPRADWKGGFDYHLRVRTADGRSAVRQKAHFIGPEAGERR